MDSHGKNLEMHNPPLMTLLRGQLKCSDFRGNIYVGWFVLFITQLLIRSNSPVQKRCCRLSEVQEGAGTCQYILTAARNSGSSGRDSEGILPVTSVEPVHIV